MSKGEVAERLAALGARRREEQTDAEVLAAEIRREVAAARGVIPMTEIARLLGMDRTSVYRTYVETA